MEEASDDGCTDSEPDCPPAPLDRVRGMQMIHEEHQKRVADSEWVPGVED